MKRTTRRSLPALVIASLFATGAFAEIYDQPMHATNSTMPGMVSGPAAPMPVSESKGVVHGGQGTITRIDAEAGKIGLKHGPIKTLNRPAMSMDFSVADPALLKPLRAGQEVTFDMKPGAKGQWVITRIVPSR